MNKTAEKYLTVTGLLFSFCLIGLLLVNRAQALTYDFNNGTNQGWTVEFNTDPGADPAFWYDGVNYSGNPAIGRPPVYGPQDDFDGSIGAIGGTGGDDSISVFSSIVFWVPLAMDNISARFIISGMEHGIPASLNVCVVSASVRNKKYFDLSRLVGCRGLGTDTGTAAQNFVT